MNRILKIGFKYAGQWTISGDGIKPAFQHYANAHNVLYAFVSNGNVMYIGKTAQPLSKRFYGYENPSSSQTTNVKNNKNITNMLAAGDPLDIFVLPDNGLMHYGDFHINLAAGLEDSLIGRLDPPWNGRQHENAPTESVSITAGNVVEPERGLATFRLRLGAAYYNQGFINVPVEFTTMLGTNGVELEIFLGDTPDPIVGYINRTANKNATPRLMGGILQKTWIQSGFSQGQEIDIEILSPTSIRIYAP